MASVTKRGKKYQYAISYTKNGKSQLIRKGGFSSKKEAIAAAAEIEAKLNKGITPFLKPAPIDEYFENWVKLYKSNLTTATLNHYRYTYDRIKAFFASSPLQDITTQDYQMFLNQLGSGRSKDTVEKVHGHIRACVRDAVDEQIIPRDFTRKGKLRYTVEAKDETEKHINYNDSTLLLNALKKKLSSGLEYYLLLLGLVSGFRFEELVGLTFEDFDFVNNKVNVNKTWGYNNKMELGFGPTKNKQSIREISFDEKTMNLFKDLFKNLPDNANHLVFYNPRSKYKVITNERANKILREILLELKISPTITMHGLRHTHGSVLLYKKADVQYVSDRLGHKDIETTLKRYAHLLKESKDENDQLAIKTFFDMYD